MTNEYIEPDDTPIATDEDTATESILDEIERLNKAGDRAESPTPTDPIGEAPTTPVADAPVAEAPVAEAPVDKAPSPEPDATKQAIFQAQRERDLALEQARRLQAEAQKAQTQAQAIEYRDSLVNEGYSLEEANRDTQQRIDAYNRTLQEQQKGQNREAFLQGQFRAALHFGRQYGINPEDLIQYSTPQAMELAAKNAKELNDLKNQVKKLTQDKVPSQTFDNGVSSGPSQRDDDYWMDRYSNNDRSERAVAAGRRAAGLS